jgi:hypothetical protein
MSRFKKSLVMSYVSSALILGVSVPAFAGSKTGAFIGGVAAARVGQNMRARTQAEQEQAYYAQQQAQRPVQQAAPSSGGSQSAESRIKELDKLAAGGYITPDEYKKKKQAILDSM